MTPACPAFPHNKALEQLVPFHVLPKGQHSPSKPFVSDSANHVVFSAWLVSPASYTERHKMTAIPCALVAIIDAAVFTTSPLNCRIYRTVILTTHHKKTPPPLWIQFMHACGDQRCDTAFPPRWTAAGGWHCVGRSFCLSPRWSVKILISWQTYVWHSGRTSGTLTINAPLVLWKRTPGKGLGLYRFAGEACFWLEYPCYRLEYTDGPR